MATSSRATLGGMIANDSSGAHTPVYGTHRPACPLARFDHWPTGKYAHVGPGLPALPQQNELVDALADRIRCSLPNVSPAC